MIVSRSELMMEVSARKLTLLMVCLSHLFYNLVYNLVSVRLVVQKVAQVEVVWSLSFLGVNY